MPSSLRGYPWSLPSVPDTLSRMRAWLQERIRSSIVLCNWTATGARLAIRRRQPLCFDALLTDRNDPIHQTDAMGFLGVDQLPRVGHLPTLRETDLSGGEERPSVRYSDADID